MIKLMLTVFFLLIQLSLNNIRAKQEALELKLDRLMEAKGINTKPEIDQELRQRLVELLEEKKQIRAVKLLRDERKMDLIEAKRYVDDLQEHLL